jgi:DNA invertase Pin-like site-specific DNA recombinase
MNVGYVRVSTEEQNTVRQEVLMRELGVEKVFVDRASGKNAERVELQKMLGFVREGDTVVVESYSRLARSTRDLLDIVEALKAKGVEFVSRKEAIDTATPAGRLMVTIFAGLYQFEREMMLERQAEGIREARKAGKYLGRIPIAVDETKWGVLYRDWKAGKISAVEAQKRLGLSASTFYRRVKAFERAGSAKP